MKALTVALVVFALAAGFLAGQAVPRPTVQASPLTVTDHQKAQLVVDCYRMVHWSSVANQLDFGHINSAQNCLWEVRRISGDHEIGTDLRGPNRVP